MKVELLGYTDLIDESVNDGYYIVTGIETNNWGTGVRKSYINYHWLSAKYINVIKKSGLKNHQLK